MLKFFLTEKVSDFISNKKSDGNYFRGKSDGFENGRKKQRILFPRKKVSEIYSAEKSVGNYFRGKKVLKYFPSKKSVKIILEEKNDRFYF